MVCIDFPTVDTFVGTQTTHLEKDVLRLHQSFESRSSFVFRPFPRSYFVVRTLGSGSYCPHLYQRRMLAQLKLPRKSLLPYVRVFHQQDLSKLPSTLEHAKADKGGRGKTRKM